MSLAPEPIVQLEYLEKMLEGRNKGEEIDNKMLILHIRLLCQSKDKANRKKIVHELRANNYPLDDCLELCRKYEIKDAWAYLEERRGGSLGINKAIDLQFQVRKIRLTLIYKFLICTYRFSRSMLISASIKNAN